MFDIGWSELVVIAVVALIAIGPKELPGVLRMVGQWMGKARKMAAEFQGQFQEAMREAEMADLKKSFDEVKEAATGFTGGNLMKSLEKDVSSALRIDDIDKPAADLDAPAPSSSDTPAPANSDTAAVPVTDMPEPPPPPQEVPIPQTFTAAEADAAAAEPLAILRDVEAQPAPVPQDIQPAAPAPADLLKDAKAS
jgi:sec-independent protein translocase protein TatB